MSQGPGLFHFRAELNETQMGSFCSLSTQFTVSRCRRKALAACPRVSTSVVSEELAYRTSLCPTHAQVFVESQPLTRYEEQIISSVTAVTWGVTISLAYLVHYCLSKTKVRKLQLKYRTNRQSH